LNFVVDITVFELAIVGYHTFAVGKQGNLFLLLKRLGAFLPPSSTTRVKIEAQ